MLNSIGSGQNKGGIERKEEMELRKDEPLQKKVAEEESAIVAINRAPFSIKPH
jgi:hypothetical protein